MAPGSVIQSVNDLPHRFLPDRANGLDVRFRLRVGSLVRDVVVKCGFCTVEDPQGAPKVTISTSPATWLEIHSGSLSGVEAFAQRRLTMRGSIQRALLFEPLFERPDNGGMSYRVENVETEGARFSTFFAGPENGPPVLLLHGLGATKASVLTLVPHLARHYRVMAVDLPGFGASSKPRGRYDAPWFAQHVFNFMDALGISKTRLVGNSMGGRISQEMGLMDPSRVEAMALLSPATAFAVRPGLRIVRLLRPELGIAAGFMPRGRVQAVMKSLFAKPSRIESAWYEAATDDFLQTWKSPRARMAFFAAARNIYLDEPYGDQGMFTRLATLKPKALYVYGRQDVLITPHYAKKIQRTIPTARVELWDDCGHAPQLEHPERTAGVIEEFFNPRRRWAAV